MSMKTLSVQCPSCKKNVLMTKESPFRPFCSERCKSLDFADWADETHRIPGQSISPDENWNELKGLGNDTPER